ncbi:proteasome component pup2 [Diaporthe eres]|uniref:Proteasome component pup2 n=1 Tax=Diaporthe eres TaxID=83184 RepID=A0ABR1PKS8_DIAER
MFMARSEYDRGISTFSPEGRLFQVEYSLEAIKLGSTAIGVATNEGVVLGVEKRVTSTLLETSSVEKIVEIDRHIGCAMSGLQADARSMVEHARVECQSHAFNYNESLRVESCTQAICDLALRFGESADGEESIMSRPFGVALLIAGYDEDGPSLYHAEPSGTFYRYDAKAIGSGSEGAQAELQNEYHKSLTLIDAETLVLKTLKQVMEEKLDSKNVQLASVTKEKGFRIYTDEEMAAVELRKELRKALREIEEERDQLIQEIEKRERVIQQLAEMFADDPEQMAAMPPHVRAQLVASGFLGDSGGAS